MEQLLLRLVENTAFLLDLNQYVIFASKWETLLLSQLSHFIFPLLLISSLAPLNPILSHNLLDVIILIEPPVTCTDSRQVVEVSQLPALVLHHPLPHDRLDE